MTEALESALVIRVPEAEALVAGFRQRYDPVAPLGVPAHITLLYPFIPPEHIDQAVKARLSQLFSAFSGFDLELTGIDEFPDALFLAPQPVERILSLIGAITAAFPGYPPYGGRFPEPIPHLTVAMAADPAEIGRIRRQFEAQAANALPIRQRVDEVCLLVEGEGRWSADGTFALA